MAQSPRIWALLPCETKSPLGSLWRILVIVVKLVDVIDVRRMIIPSGWSVDGRCRLLSRMLGCTASFDGSDA